jgi:nuclear pore complex protein Nup155
LNDLALQFSEMPREFMVVTNSGIIFLVRRRVVDYLKAVLEEVNLRGNIQPIIEFRDR